MTTQVIIPTETLRAYFAGRFPGLIRQQVNDCAILAARYGLEFGLRKAEKLQARAVLVRVQLHLYWDKINFRRIDAHFSELCENAWIDVQRIVSPQIIAA